MERAAAVLNSRAILIEILATELRQSQVLAARLAIPWIPAWTCT
jgi:N12 class adenine-specific DNA methylase